MSQVRADLALGVVGADGIGVSLSMRRAALRGEHDIARGPDLDLPGELLGFIHVHVANDLVT
jgi:hypothetical protein